MLSKHIGLQSLTKKACMLNTALDDYIHLRSRQQGALDMFFWKMETLFISRRIYQGDTSSWKFPSFCQKGTQPTKVWQESWHTCHWLSILRLDRYPCARTKKFLATCVKKERPLQKCPAKYAVEGALDNVWALRKCHGRSEGYVQS